MKVQGFCCSVLERVEIDHTKLDLFVVDQKTNLPIGRPWLTACCSGTALPQLHVDGFSQFEQSQMLNRSEEIEGGSV
jgi:hypothetical protein